MRCKHTKLVAAIYASSLAFIKNRQIADRSELKGVIMEMVFPLGAAEHEYSTGYSGGDGDGGGGAHFYSR